MMFAQSHAYTETDLGHIPALDTRPPYHTAGQPQPVTPSRQIIDIYCFPAGDGGYTVRLHSGMGAAQGQLDPYVLDLTAQLTDPLELGCALFDALFHGPLYARYVSARDYARLNQQECHIRLHLQESPELAVIPWEMLYDADRRSFLSLSSLTPVVRFLQIAQPDPPQQVAWPIRVLGMVSAPQGMKSLDAAVERRSIGAAVAEINAQHSAEVVTVRWLHDATPRALQNALREEQYHIFHFIGHGVFDEAAQNGSLVLEDDRQQPLHLSAQALVLLLQDHFSLRLAVINACQGATASPATAFAGVAQTLIQAGLPAAIAMQAPISDAAATLFAQEFYGSLADGKRVHYAVGEARKSVFIHDNPLEWATPVLFSQIEDGQIFQMPGFGPGAVQAEPVERYTISVRDLLQESGANEDRVH